MADAQQGVFGEIAHKARDAAVLVIARLWPGRDFATVERLIAQKPTRVQAEVTLLVLGFLFLLALFAGQFGPIGVMLYFAAVLFTVR